MVERRPYFVIGDLVSNALAGAVVAVLVTRVESLISGWPVLAGMLIGMVMGQLVAMLLSMVASTFLGAHEVMLPMMTTGMVVGMLAGMSAVEGGLPPEAAAARGALVGLAVLVGTYVLNSYVRSKGDVWTS